MRALAAVTDNTIPAAQTFARVNPELNVNWYTMPYFDRFPNAASQNYRERESSEVTRHLHAMIRSQRPDVIIIGREILAWCIPEVTLIYEIPTVMLVHGGPSTQIVDGVYPIHLIKPLLERFSNVNVVVAVAEHWAIRLRQLGLSNVLSISNPVDLEHFYPQQTDTALRHDLGVDDDQAIVLHASNLQPEKRVVDLIWSASQSWESPGVLAAYLGYGETKRAS